MARARSHLGRSIAAHAVLIAYTLIALFPVFVIVINSFKSRKAIFADPLALPGPESFDLIGYQTVMRQGDFLLYFQNSMVVTCASLFCVLLFGAMAAFALSEYRFRGNSLIGLYRLMWFCESCNNKLPEYKFHLENIEKDFLPRFRDLYGSKDLRTCKKCGTVMEADPKFV